MTDSRPTQSAPYRAGPMAREIKKQGRDRMLIMGGVRTAQTEWDSQNVLVQKEDGAFCSGVNYQKLNAMTVRDSYKIQCMTEETESLGSAAIFSTLDANSRYCKFEIGEQVQDKPIFISLRPPPSHLQALRIESRPWQMTTSNGCLNSESQLAV